jgi:hypothetical protein
VYLPAPAGQLGSWYVESMRACGGVRVRARARAPGRAHGAGRRPRLRGSGWFSQHVTCSAQPASPSRFRGLRRLPAIATSAPNGRAPRGGGGSARLCGRGSETAASRRASTSLVCVCLSLSAGRRAASLCRRDGFPMVRKVKSLVHGAGYGFSFRPLCGKLNS